MYKIILNSLHMLFDKDLPSQPVKKIIYFRLVMKSLLKMGVGNIAQRVNLWKFQCEAKNSFLF